MATKSQGGSVEVRETSIRLKFTYAGERRAETLRLLGEPLVPTPANVKKAGRILKELLDKIKYGTFVYADYFPDSPNATTGQGNTVGDQLDTWIGLRVHKKGSTLKADRVSVAWWKGHFGDKQLRALKHSDILKALASEPTWKGKTQRNKLSALRQALALAVKDGAISANPCIDVETVKDQRQPPDPFSLEEAEAILAELRRRDEQISLYFEFKFFTGLRTSESLALRWSHIDFRLSHMVISEGIVLGEHIETTKTSTARVVQLNSRALAVLQAMKAHTFLRSKKRGDDWVFVDSRTNERFTDDEPPRELYWRPSLKKIGMRYRSPYHTRHTYASMMLMAGVTPAYGAKQMGHSIEMFQRTYAKWIDGGQNEVEMNKVESLICPRAVPEIGKTAASS